MASLLKLKKSSVSGKVPVAADLEHGELAINYADGVLYYKNSNNAISSIGIQGIIGNQGITGAQGVQGAGAGLAVTEYINYTYTADGNTTTYTATSGITVDNVLVSLNGILQRPTVDYTVSGSNIVLDVAPSNGVVVQIRVLGGLIGPQGIAGSGSQGTAGTLMQASLIDSNNNITNSITDVTALRFDTDSGFDLTDLGNGAVKVGMNSTFKTWQVAGQTDLVATGLDTIEFVAGNGIQITTDPNTSPKSITFNSTVSQVQGLQGIQGIQGIIGVNGAQGIQGTTGNDGSQGTIGNDGSQGISGTAGIDGSQGIQGTTGNDGYQGIQGTTGNDGSQGIQGIQGFIGADGLQGYIGTQGSLGIQGSTGSGIQGPTGTQGIQGLIGNGVQGIQGIQGIQGQSTILERHYNLPGTVNISTGTSRWWIQSNILISQLRAQVSTAPTGTSIILSIKKNASEVAQLTIAATTNSIESNVNINSIKGDYFTVDVLQKGSSIAGTDLVISFLYNRA